MLHWLDEVWNGSFLGAVLTHGVRILVILIVAGIVRAVADRMIDRAVRSMVSKRSKTRTKPAKAVAKPAELVVKPAKLVAKKTVFADERREQRIGALGSLGRSAVLIILLVIVALMIMTELGFNISALLAGTSIVGIAVAFGVQTVLRDIISGILMLFEDQIGLGDYVRVGDVDGVVEDIGLRLTQIRDEAGTVWYLRNGDIAKVGNYSQGSGTGRPPVPESELAESESGEVSAPPDSDRS
jgi:small conductance mechanosensitive channel